MGETNAIIFFRPTEEPYRTKDLSHGGSPGNTKAWGLKPRATDVDSVREHLLLGVQISLFVCLQTPSLCLSVLTHLQSVYLSSYTFTLSVHL